MSTEVFKKILMTRTNNTLDEIDYSSWAIPSIDKARLESLRKLIGEKGYQPNTKSEIETIKYSLRWVSEQWKHDGVNQPPVDATAEYILRKVYEEKQRFRCVEYGVVLAEVLQSQGFISRTLSLASTDVAYGIGGQGHVTSEVWVNELQKWVFLDPQFAIYLTGKDSEIPLSFYEVHLLRKAGQWEDVKINILVPLPEEWDPQEAFEEYKNFLKNYFGSIAIAIGKDRSALTLLLESKDMFMTFQGMTMKSRVFTEDPAKIYPVMNRVNLSLQYRTSTISFPEILAKFNITDDESFRKAVPQYAPAPEYHVTPTSQMPLLKGYEYRFDQIGDWNFSTEAKFPWDATKSLNLLEVRAVNEAGYRSPITFIELTYQ